MRGYWSNKGGGVPAPSPQSDYPVFGYAYLPDFDVYLSDDHPEAYSVYITGDFITKVVTKVIEGTTDTGVPWKFTLIGISNALNDNGSPAKPVAPFEPPGPFPYTMRSMVGNLNISQAVRDFIGGESGVFTCKQNRKYVGVAGGGGPGTVSGTWDARLYLNSRLSNSDFLFSGNYQTPAFWYKPTVKNLGWRKRSGNQYGMLHNPSPCKTGDIVGYVCCSQANYYSPASIDMINVPDTTSPVYLDPVPALSSAVPRQPLVGGQFLSGFWEVL